MIKFEYFLTNFPALIVGSTFSMVSKMIEFASGMSSFAAAMISKMSSTEMRDDNDS